MDFSLFTTCISTYKESYPVFISRNNFSTACALEFCFHNPYAFSDNIREVTITWYHECYSFSAYNQLNLGRLRDILRYSKVHTVHVQFLEIGRSLYFEVGSFERDFANEPCIIFRNKYQDKEATEAFIKHSVLKALLAIPGIRGFTFLDYKFRETKELKALGEYMTEKLVALRTQGYFKATIYYPNNQANYK